MPDTINNAQVADLLRAVREADEPADVTTRATRLLNHYAEFEPGGTSIDRSYLYAYVVGSLESTPDAGLMLLRDAVRLILRELRALTLGVPQ